jgi:hypothetical protein
MTQSNQLDSTHNHELAKRVYTNKITPKSIALNDSELVLEAALAAARHLLAGYFMMV